MSRTRADRGRVLQQAAKSSLSPAESFSDLSLTGQPAVQAVRPKPVKALRYHSSSASIAAQAGMSILANQPPLPVEEEKAKYNVHHLTLLNDLIKNYSDQVRFIFREKIRGYECRLGFGESEMAKKICQVFTNNAVRATPRQTNEDLFAIDHIEISCVDAKNLSANRVGIANGLEKIINELQSSRVSVTSEREIDVLEAAIAQMEAAAAKEKKSQLVRMGRQI